MSQEEPITSSLIETLQSEGDKIWKLLSVINSDLHYKRAINSIKDSNFKNVQYKFEHLLLHDLIQIYSEISTTYNGKTSIAIRAKFILIYFYERLQGRNISRQYNILDLQKLTRADQFKKNFKLIVETSFFQVKKGLETEILATYILLKLDSTHFNAISSFLNRSALLMVKLKQSLSEEQQIILKNVATRISNPTISDSNYQGSSIPPDDSLEKVMTELNNLIGLNHIKQSIQDLTNFLKVQKLRNQKGLKTNHNSLHIVFMGPPGTGKTTIARLLGRIYKHLGYLKKGHLIETDRSGLVAGYVGQTAIKTDEIINSAKDGVLFIDEAYSLTNGGMNDFGMEAIEVLLKRMEDHRQNLVVIVAGYPDEMEIFLQANPGLQSRFNRYFTFEHFKEKTLLEIFKLYTKNSDFELTNDAEEKLSDIIYGLCQKRHRGFGNARVMRNLFEKIIERQANRVVNSSEITERLLIQLTEEDIPEVKQTVKEILHFSSV